MAMAMSTGWSAEDLLGAELQGTQGAGLITSPEQAINVFDFEDVARAVMNPAHFGHIATGSDDDATVAANRDGFSKYVIHPRRLVNVSKIDTSIELFGKRLGTPIFLAPAGGQMFCNPEGEIATAKAAVAHDNTMILSTGTTSSIEDVTAARGAPVWFQLYPNGSLSVSRKLIQRAEAAGAPVIAMTVDQLPGRNTETDQRMRRTIPGYTGVREKSPACLGCHAGNRNARRPMTSAALSGDRPGEDAKLDWDFVRQVRDVVKGKFMLKGVVTPEDAELSLKYGLDGVYVSNHGGRSAATGYGTIEALPAIVKAVAGRVPIVIDGGIRRGTDVFKALALGASAVSVGRPYLWGLGSFGQPGVAKVLDILQREFALVMKQAGVTSIPAIAAGRYVTAR
ncbi:MAG: alpha-hydroxy-acid oxidizing protein [Acidobacteria bacterium]|nr:alpha-hydroxy-acid oxidizing protein [Acidobacteriota bacterium]